MSDVSTPTDAQAARLAAGQGCLEAALTFLAYGIAPLCCCDPDHIAVRKQHAQECGSPGKAPMRQWKAWQTQLPTRADVQALWDQYPIGNVGIVLGQGSGVVRIDSDGAAGIALLQAWSGGDLPPTWTFLSPSGGQGWLYAWPRDLFCKTTTKAAPGEHQELRLMGNGSQTIVPPSRHPKGGHYVWASGASPNDLPLAPAPAWLIARLHAPAPTPASAPPWTGPRTADYDRVMQALALIPSDDYDDWLLVGMALHHTGAPWARDTWDTWSRQSAKFDETKQEKSWASFGASKKVVTLGSLFHRAYPQRPAQQAPQWHTRTTRWTGQFQAIRAEEIPSWHS
jgi:hypothetical protein